MDRTTVSNASGSAKVIVTPSKERETFCSVCRMHIPPTASGYDSHMDSKQHREKAGLPPSTPSLADLAKEPVPAQKGSDDDDDDGVEPTTTKGKKRRVRKQRKKQLEESITEATAKFKRDAEEYNRRVLADGPDDDVIVLSDDEGKAPPPKKQKKSDPAEVIDLCEDTVPACLLVNYEVEHENKKVAEAPPAALSPEEAAAAAAADLEEKRKVFEDSMDFVPLGDAAPAEDPAATAAAAAALATPVGVAAEEPRATPGDDADKVEKHIVFSDSEDDVVTMCKRCGTGQAKLPPWVSEEDQVVLRDLDSEIAAFIGFASLTDEETRARESVFALVKNTAEALWPGSTVLHFGSYSTGMSLPCSDIDVVIMNSNSRNGLTTLANHLRGTGCVKTLKVIHKAKIPLIKLVEKAYNICVDISFDVDNGPKAVPGVVAWAEEFPLLRSLVIIVKQYLYSENLADPFTGGLGSYALICMAVSYLQLEHRKDDKRMGAALLGFLNFYGNKFNYYNVGIRVDRGGSYFCRSQDYNYRKVTVCIEDPQDRTNEVGRSSFEMLAVRASFQKAHDRLRNHRCAGCGAISALFNPDIVRGSVGVKTAFMTNNALKKHEREKGKAVPHDRAVVFVADDAAVSDVTSEASDDIWQSLGKRNIVVDENPFERGGGTFPPSAPKETLPKKLNKMNVVCSCGLVAQLQTMEGVEFMCCQNNKCTFFQAPGFPSSLATPLKRSSSKGTSGSEGGSSSKKRRKRR